MAIRIVLITISLFFSLLTFSQKLVGTVQDAVTAEPIPFVNVFFAGTLIGDVTEPDGSFEITEIAEGKYDLTASFVGYDTYTEPIVISSGEELRLKIKLQASATELPEVFINADTTHWRNDFDTFRKYLLGISPNQESTKISDVNASNLHLYFDYKSGELVAHAKEPIFIENEDDPAVQNTCVNWMVRKLDLSRSWIHNWRRRSIREIQGRGLWPLIFGLEKD